ncbi:MAG TPA: DUF418 domain-containing protein [Allosphingosinicella sp.]|nr:DUF418 domain-containing protein [Allosphingosinicella sp.]
MTAVTAAPPRIQTLDTVRGIAVMGILAMNIVAFAMPFQAYMNPLAYGTESAADLASWAFNFVFIDGKMRGLFSFLFGASMLLVIERAEASGRSPARIHYARMLWLLVFGLLHFFFIWHGDILAGYAQIGLIAFFFRRLSVRALMRWGIGLVVVQLLLFSFFAFSTFYLQSEVAGRNPSADAIRQWQEMQGQIGVPTQQALSEKLALFTGPYSGIVHHQLEKLLEPFMSLLFFGCETLAYFLFGMAALKSGFFRGEWAIERYRRIALIGFAIGIPVYGLLAAVLLRADFDLPMIVAAALAATVPFRPVMVLAIAALIILLTRSGGGFVERIAAAGRAAFTNYLGASILMTGLFYGWGFGLFGSMSRIELWIVVVAMWALMLTWSKPWLERFQYGPFEWLWRSLSRWELQPMRRRREVEPAAAAV